MAEWLTRGVSDEGGWPSEVNGGDETDGAAAGGGSQGLKGLILEIRDWVVILGAKKINPWF